jgi:peroxiredoxin
VNGGRIFVAAAVVGVIALVALGSLRSPGTGTVPSFVFPDLAGKTVRIDDLRGKVVVLNLWATWCPPCVEEMPSLEALARKMAGRDLVVLAVSQDELPDKVKPWIDERRFRSMTVLLDARGELGNALGVTGYPETFVVDRQGKIVLHHIGYRDWASPDVVAALERLLASGEWRG